MKKIDQEPVITITTASTDEVRNFLKKDMHRERESNKRFKIKLRSFRADDLKPLSDDETIPYHTFEKGMSNVDPIAGKAFRVFQWDVESEGRAWREMEVGVNPLGEIDEILDEPSHDAEKEKVIMVIFSTTTIDVFVVHPKDKQGTLTDYQKRV